MLLRLFLCHLYFFCHCILECFYDLDQFPNREGM